jgi:transposase
MYGNACGMSDSQAQQVKHHLAEVQVIRQRLGAPDWGAEEWARLDVVLASYARMLTAFLETKISLKRLLNLLFGGRRRRRKSPEVESASGDAGSAPDNRRAEGVGTGADLACGDSPSGSDPSSVADEAREAQVRRKGGHLPGTGRLGADAYTGSERAECRHEELSAGQICPVCGQGRLYGIQPGVEIRINGGALLSAIRYELEKLRCSACGAVFTAPLPKEAGAAKYSARAGAVLAVSRYYLGLPFYRIERYQSMLGVPVPDATQWDLVERVGDSAHRVFTHLEELAAQGELIYQDDTPVRILSLIDENQQIQAHAEASGLSRATERTGMYTTALAVKVEGRTICLYYSGRSHAGENLQALLNKRQAEREGPLVMSDALTSNEADEGRLVRCHCMAHGRRKFSELEDVFPQECQVVLDTLKQVFDHDEEARKQQMDALSRLSYHQQYSRPLMDGLKGWLKRQFDERLVEPNSSLGKAIAYMQGHWETLTRFLQVAGAPLDNNLAERSLKLFIRQRKNSLFFATEHSAYLGSLLTSVIATCVHAGVNAVDYLEALQENRHEVFVNPAAWLPWTYRGSRSPPQLSLRQSCAMRA